MNGSQGLDLPGEFVARMRASLGAATDEFIAHLLQPEDGLRANTLRTDPQRLAERLPISLAPIDGLPEGFVVGPDGAGVGAHPLHAAGLFYLQDPAAMRVARLVDPAPGERILDLSAAPGGKTTHLAALMENWGLLVANDVVVSRGMELVGNLERCGVTNVVVTCETPSRLRNHFGATFDRVLLDAPCSGEAMFAKSAAARTDWSPETVAGCARRQADILEDAVELLRPGGTLVYSTCTFSHEENESVVLDAVERFGLVVQRLAPPGGWVEASWKGKSVGLRSWPHLAPGAGHFVAALRKPAGPELTGRQGKPLPAAGRTEKGLVQDFLRDALPGAALDLSRLVARGDRVVLPPDPAVDVDGLRVLREGLEVGRLRKGRFEPAHALALAFPLGAVMGPVDLAADDPRLADYLAGEVIHAEGRSGWTVVGTEGFALGWGKRTGSQIKNHYPKGLRRR